MTRSYSIHCLVLLNVGRVKMTSFMSYRTNIMRILGYKIFHRKLKIGPMLIRKVNVEYLIAQTNHKRRNLECDFHKSTPFRTYLSLLVTQYAMQR